MYGPSISIGLKLWDLCTIRKKLNASKNTDTTKTFTNASLGLL